MEIHLWRRYRSKSYCIGRLYIDGKYFCDVLEDMDRGIDSSMKVSDIERRKVYGETAIPLGRYEVKLTYSPKFATRQWCSRYKGILPLLCDVPAFSGVRIHVGNKPEDSLGCLLVGENKVKGQVIHSTETFYRLMDEHILPAVRKRKEQVFITISYNEK